jgi:hypothetical protein
MVERQIKVFCCIIMDDWIKLNYCRVDTVSNKGTWGSTDAQTACYELGYLDKVKKDAWQLT